MHIKYRSSSSIQNVNHRHVNGLRSSATFAWLELDWWFLTYRFWKNCNLQFFQKALQAITPPISGQLNPSKDWNTCLSMIHAMMKLEIVFNTQNVIGCVAWLYIWYSNTWNTAYCHNLSTDRLHLLKMRTIVVEIVLGARQAVSG